MAARKRLGWGDWMFLGLLACASYAGVSWLLAGDGSSHGPRPIVFDERVSKEPDPFIADIRALTQLVDQRYAYLEHRRRRDDLDLAALEAAALAALHATPDEATFRREIRRFVAGLRDGHAYVEFVESRLPSVRHWPFTALCVTEGVMIDGVHPDASEQLRRGDLLVAVDGVAIERHIERVAAETCASTDAARRVKALGWLTDWACEESIELTLTRADGEVVAVRVECPLLRLRIPTPGALPTGREVRMLDGGVGYFRPGDFAAPADSGWATAPPEQRGEILAGSYAEFDRIFGGFVNARGLILDLRGNPGGTDLLGQALVGHLLDPGFTYFRLSALGDDGWRAPLPAGSAAPLPARRVTGPLVCLIDERTFSVADNVAACLREVHPRVTFVGRATGAGTGAPRAFALPRTGTRVTFCTQRVYSPSGALIEGAGVTPEVVVVRSRDDVLAGRDPALEVARRVLAK